MKQQQNPQQIDYKDKDDEQQRLLAILEYARGFLRFPREVERDFQQDYAVKFRLQMFVATLLIVVIFFLTGVFDFVYVHEWQIPVLIRFGIIGPSLLLLLILSATPAFVSIEQFILLLVSVFIGVGWLTIAFVLPDPMKTTYYHLLPLILIYAFTLARLQFKFALMVEIILIIALNTCLLLDSSITLYKFATYNFLFTSISILALLTNYSMEKYSRRDYLQSRLLALEKQALEQANVHLQDLANLDAVTGIANRHRFNSVIDKEWNRAQRFEYAMAIFLVDIDAFKVFNDNYGHHQGDICLRSIAKLLATQTRRPGDLAARYGGDEFILVFEGVKSIDEMVLIAENILQAVKQLAIPHEKSSHNKVVTVTIGLASITPTQDDSPQHLVNQADVALYQGKLKGRDCVVVYSGEGEVAPDKSE